MPKNDDDLSFKITADLSDVDKQIEKLKGKLDLSKSLRKGLRNMAKETRAFSETTADTKTFSKNFKQQLSVVEFSAKDFSRAFTSPMKALDDALGTVSRGYKKLLQEHDLLVSQGASLGSPDFDKWGLKTKDFSLYWTKALTSLQRYTNAYKKLTDLQDVRNNGAFKNLGNYKLGNPYRVIKGTGDVKRGRYYGDFTSDKVLGKTWQLDARKEQLSSFYTQMGRDKDKKLTRLTDRKSQLESDFLQSEEGSSQRKSVEFSLKRINSQIEKYQQQAKEASKVSPFTKLINQIKRISIYRIIRSFLKTLTQMGKQGLGNFVQYSDSANESMSNLTASFNQISNTLGVTISSVLQTLEPVITAVADGLVDILNAFNAAMAAMSGSSTYTKVVKTTEDYAASLNEATAAFDKFQSLSTSSTVEYQEVSVDDSSTELVETFTALLDIFKSIGSVLSEIWNTLSDSGALTTLLNVFNSIATVIGSVLSGLASFIVTLDNIGVLDDVIYGLAYAFATLAFVLAVARLAAGDWSALPKVIASLAAIGIIMGASSGSSLSTNISSGTGFTAMADGGFSTANFIAVNENGAREWVGTQAGTTAVVNDTEMSDIMFDAVREGCYEGVAAALGDSSESSSTSTTSVSVYGDTILDVVISAARKRGLTFSKV